MQRQCETVVFNQKWLLYCTQCLYRLKENLQLHFWQRSFHAMIWNFYMARLVTNKLAITANISLFSQSEWNACQAYSAGSSTEKKEDILNYLQFLSLDFVIPFDSLCNKYMVHVNVQLGTAPFELLSFGQVIWHQVMSAKMINTKLFLQFDIQLYILRKLENYCRDEFSQVWPAENQ